MQIQKSVTFANKNLKANRTKIINIANLEIIVIIQGHVEVLHIAYVI